MAVATTVILDGQITNAEKTDLFTVLSAETASAIDRESTKFANKFAHGVMLVAKLANEVGTAEYTPAVQTFDEDGNAIRLWTAASALSAAGTYTYLLFPGGATGGGSGITQAADIVLPRIWDFLLIKTGDTDQSFDTEVYGMYL